MQKLFGPINTRLAMFLLSAVITLSDAGAEVLRTAPFPPIGGGAAQMLNLYVTALGTSASPCNSKVSFRIAGGETVGPADATPLPLGGVKKVSLQMDSLALRAGERAQIQPVIELADASCFASVELVDRFGRSDVFVSGSLLAPRRPDNALDSPFIEARRVDSVELAVARMQPGEGAVQPCDVHAGFRDELGKTIGPEEDVSLAPNGVRILTLKIADTGSGSSVDLIRTLLDIRPLKDGSGTGCTAAAAVIDPDGNTIRYTPIALGVRTEALAIPPPRPPKEDPPPLPPVGGPVPIGETVAIRSPLGLPPVAYPEDNPPTKETIALGRRLFYDKRLSIDGTTACASCHDPLAGFSDPRRLSLGVNATDGERHSMSVVNAALSQEVFWDGRANGLEAQAREPIRGALEFAHSLSGAEQRFQADPGYVKQFEEAFGPGPIIYDMAAKAIASFERTLLSGNSPFDRYFFLGDRNAISASAQRGFEFFRGAAGCTACHQVEGSYATFGNSRFFNTGVAATSVNTLADQGRWNVTGTEADRGAFRPPSLRNIALRAPYMHDGKLATLADVARFYSRGGIRNRWLSAEMPVPAPNINPQIFLDVEEFLRSLTGEAPENSGPPEGQ